MKRMMQRLRPLQWVLAPAIMLLAAIGLWRQIRLLSLHQLNVALSETPTSAIALSLLATALSFACLSWYEWFATCRTVPERIPARVALAVGAMSHAISNTLGFHALTGGALRYRAYRQVGLDLTEVVRVLAVVGMCVGTGTVLVSVLALLIEAATMSNSNVILSIVGMVFLLAVVAFRLRRPNRNLASGTLGRYAGLSIVAALEMNAAIAALYVLLPAHAVPALAPFVLTFVGAMLLGIVSHAPGGIGVFEASMLTAMPMPGDEAPRVLVALLLYRVLYNLVPFLIATTALAIVWPRYSASTATRSVRPSV